MDIPNNQQPPNPSSLAIRLPKIVFIVLLFFVTLLGLAVAGDYFKVFPFSNYSSIIKNPFQKPEVKTESEIPGVTLTVVDKERLMKYLKDYKFFEDKVKLLGDLSNRKIDVKRLVFKMVNQEQDQQKVIHPTKGTIFSLGQEYIPNKRTLIVKIYFQQKFLKNSGDDVPHFLDGEIITGVYKATHALPLTNPEITNNYLQAVKDSIDELD